MWYYMEYGKILFADYLKEKMSDGRSTKDNHTFRQVRLEILKYWYDMTK